jgi:transposase
LISIIIIAATGTQTKLAAMSVLYSRGRFTDVPPIIRVCVNDCRLVCDSETSREDFYQGDWADLSGQSVSLFNPAVTTRTKVEDLGLFTGQIGYAWNAALLYLKGGAAFARNRFDVFTTLGGNNLERFPLDLNREDYRGSLGRANQIRFLRRQRGCAMAKGYSKDLRERVVSIVEEGDSAREAARLLNVGASTAIRWIERWTTTGSVEAKPGTGHSRSPLDKHEQWLLDLIAAEPDLTLDDIRLRLSGAKKLKVGTSSIWRFYDRQEITFKKNSARRRAGSS